MSHKKQHHFDPEFFRGRRILVTGHTGFKGSWLSLWLHMLGAQVTGYALSPPTNPSLFDLAGVAGLVHSVTGDVRDQAALSAAVKAAAPEIVIHMAAQPLVRESYLNPVDTYSTNVMGTVHILEAVRKSQGVKAVLNVTTDKCYENREWPWGYRENEPMGGYDPYSSSKGCSELVTAAYRNSYFNEARYADHGVALASARAGNVIGGGDWAADRLIPDCVAALLKNQPVRIRNPHAIRPWQHVLEPLSGYLALAQRLYQDGPRFVGAWNFGPGDDDAREVEWIVQRMCSRWQGDAHYVVDQGEHPHEAHYLKLDCSKAKAKLGWRPRWSLETTLDKIVDWTLAYQRGDDLREICLEQISAYTAADSESRQ
ncbi:CDP-glucose 4,6-dehydratase [Geomonas oryzae]|uniref:CDP-glucose 4,6-dehydratase n=1 Tax=Geomonas oryzae TaxID=2364273 RepID=UPI00100A67BE|nr:CDP-glucose 4,6-dehydratase [Geomonas oryzae]